MVEYALRFLAGGIAVSAFAALADTLRPKSFAGLFGAAPSIALATLLITLSHNGARSCVWCNGGPVSTLMIVQFKLSALRQTRWHEYLVRFVLGGVITVIAGLIAARFGPVVGGLFLAFPAIFPASATLIEKHVRKRDQWTGTASKEIGSKSKEK
jgi:hypothetical protein